MERHLAAILAADIAGFGRLMGADERGTLAMLQQRQAAIIEPAMTRHRGRVVKWIGDGVLAEFASVIEAVECAAEIQQANAAADAILPEPRRMALRIGVHLGDVMVEGADIFGDGVNIAARLQSIAEPGGIRISRQAFDQVEGKLALNFRGLGPQNLKNIARPIEVFAVEAVRDAAAAPPAAAPMRQEVRYCRAADGVRLAYSIVGDGPPLVKAANWLNHLENDWTSPVWGYFLRGLARDHALLRYDARGNGMSDWEVAQIDFESWVTDLETVADAAGAKRFDLFGISQGCAVSIAYAVRHPDRVRRLVLCGGYALGWSKAAETEAARAEGEAMMTLMRLGWGKPNAAFRQVFTSQFLPDGTKEQHDWFNELQRTSCTVETAVRHFEAMGNVDVRDLLAGIRCPTLVLHARGDARVPFERGRSMAAGIPGARFVALETRNHLFLEGEPAATRFFEELRLFLGA